MQLSKISQPMCVRVFEDDMDLKVNKEESINILRFYFVFKGQRREETLVISFWFLSSLVYKALDVYVLFFIISYTKST